MFHIHFRTLLGAEVVIDVARFEDLDATFRRYGRLGWTSGEIPPGGYAFPYDNFQDFDWSLIGARRWTSPEGEDLIIHAGKTYKIRTLDAVDTRKMKLPQAVKISRGARSTDPPGIVETADGDFRYVTLAVFRGGKRQERYAQRQESTPHPVPANAAD